MRGGPAVGCVARPGPQNARMQALPRRFFEQPVVALAAALLGQVVVRRHRRTLRAGRIVETEAYGGQGVDPSAHSFRGPTPRCAVMFGPAGHAYVYSTHQGRCCLNVTAQGDRTGKAVLIRALEPLQGLPAMRAARLAVLDEGPTRSRLLRGADHELAAGPGRLCLCLSIDRALNGLDLTDLDSPLWLARGPASCGTSARGPLLWTPRIGLNPGSASCGWHWRVLAASSAALSVKSWAESARRTPRPKNCPG